MAISKGPLRRRLCQAMLGRDQLYSVWWRFAKSIFHAAVTLCYARVVFFTTRTFEIYFKTQVAATSLQRAAWQGEHNISSIQRWELRVHHRTFLSRSLHLLIVCHGSHVALVCSAAYVQCYLRLLFPILSFRAVSAFSACHCGFCKNRPDKDLLIVVLKSYQYLTNDFPSVYTRLCLCLAFHSD